VKILFVHSLADARAGGGAEVTLWTLVRSLREAGHECVVLSTAPDAGLTSVTRAGVKVWYAGIKNFYWPFHQNRPGPLKRALWHAVDMYNPLMSRVLCEVIGRETPDVISLHNLPGWSAAVWRAVRRCQIPSVQVLHDYYAICAKSSMFRRSGNCRSQCATCRMLRLPHRKLSRNVSAVVGVSRYILDRHRQLRYFQNVGIQRVIRNVRARETLGIDEQTGGARKPGVFRVGYIGRLDPNKGVGLLLEVFQRMQLPNAELWIAGTGPDAYTKELRKRAKGSAARFCGYMSPSTFYPEIDVVVVPSLWNDNLPGVVFEALAFGKPLVGSRRGGIPEMIVDGKNGRLFDPENPRELEAAIGELASNAELRAEMAEEARQSARPYLDVDAWVKAYEAIYEQVVAAPESSVRMHADI